MSASEKKTKQRRLQGSETARQEPVGSVGVVVVGVWCAVCTGCTALPVSQVVLAAVVLLVCTSSKNAVLPTAGTTKTQK